MSDRPQHMDALDRANEVRLAAAAVKRDVAAQRLPLAEAVNDSRSASVTAYDLLRSLPRWGRVRTLRTLAAISLREDKRVGEMTPRQRAALGAVR